MTHPYDSRRTSIEVYKLDEDPALPCLVKTVSCEVKWNVRGASPIANKSFLGIVLIVTPKPNQTPPRSYPAGFVHDNHDESNVFLFDKGELLNSEIPPEKTARRHVIVKGQQVCINSTSLVSVNKLNVENQKSPGLPDSYYHLMKKDFWMTKKSCKI